MLCSRACSQLRSHLALAKENGVTDEELVETMTHLAFYAGWPNAVSEIGVAKEVLAPTQANVAEDAITVERHGTQPATPGPTEHFTGEVQVESRFHRASPARAGLVQSWGMPLEEIAPGDVVWIPPRVKHWHGATKRSKMSHVAIVEALDGKTADWMEQVTEAQYAGKPAE